MLSFSMTNCLKIVSNKNFLFYIYDIAKQWQKFWDKKYTFENYYWISKAIIIYYYISCKFYKFRFINDNFYLFLVVNLY